MKKNKKAVLIAPLLVVWAFVLYFQFFANEAEATVEVTPAVTPTTPDVDVPAIVSELAEPDLGIATPEILEKQHVAAREGFRRSPFTPVGVGSPTRSEFVLTSIIGRLAVINGARYRVGDEIPGKGTLKAIGQGWVEIESRGQLKRIHLARRNRSRN